jgi:hypothetical protein
MEEQHAAILTRVAKRVQRARYLRAEAGEPATSTKAGMRLVVYGALIALEYGNRELAARLLAEVLPNESEDTPGARSRTVVAKTRRYISDPVPGLTATQRQRYLGIG